MSVMTAARGPGYVPYDAFLLAESAGETRHEWVNGVVYAMSRGTPEHARLTNRVVLKVFGPLLEEGCESFSADSPIFIEAAQHHTCADASLVCGPLVTRIVHDKNGKSIGAAIVNPTVILEVLSEATERYDRDGKFEAYKKLRSFEQYVLVSQDTPQIEVRTRTNDQWTTQVACAGETIRIGGREISVDAVYR
jgi:Uma2 family endonuclease